METSTITTQDFRYSGDNVELPNGWSVHVEVEPDEDMGEPWKEHDGHGDVRIVRARHRDDRDDIGKRAGERVMHVEGGTAWLYDVAATMLIARKDGWGCRCSRTRADVPFYVCALSSRTDLQLER